MGKYPDRGKLLYSDSKSFLKKINIVYIAMYILTIAGLIGVYIFWLFFLRSNTGDRGVDDPISFIIGSIIFGLFSLFCIVLLINSLRAGIKVYTNGIQIIQIKMNVLYPKFIPYEYIKSVEKVKNRLNNEMIKLKIQDKNKIIIYNIGIGGNIATENHEKVYSIVKEKVGK